MAAIADKAGGAILITVKFAQDLIKCTNVPPLVGNGSYMASWG